jgi:oxygen-independent coproporphyrinogen-3 oxidase
VLPLDVFSRLLNVLEEHGLKGRFREFTVEVNPEDIVQKGEAYVKGLIEMGVNRISMGVQSFDDGILRWMNRRHDSETAREAYRILEDAGVQNISIDLIFGLSQLSDDQWDETLDKALSVSVRGNLPQHISAYQLSVEPGSALAQLVDRGQWSEASEELCSKQYEMLCGRLREAGYHHYEISNFAQPGYEAVHNSAYWTHKPYVGLGPGAHSYMSNVRQWNEPDLVKYVEAAGNGDFSKVQGSEVLTPEQLVMEKVMLGLRTAKGVSEELLRANCDVAQVDEALKCGNLVVLPDGMVRIPEDRFFISDSIISSII